MLLSRVTQERSLHAFMLNYISYHFFLFIYLFIYFLAVLISVSGHQRQRNGRHVGIFSRQVELDKDFIHVYRDATFYYVLYSDKQRWAKSTYATKSSPNPVHGFLWTRVTFLLCIQTCSLLS